MQVGDVLVESFLVLLDGKKIVRLFLFHQIAGRLLLGMQGISGHHAFLKIQGG